MIQYSNVKEYSYVDDYCNILIHNPFKPGAGHQPPHLAGREVEKNEMRDLLRQRQITQNVVMTGLRGVGKTVLLDTFKPMAQEMGWLWAGNDVSESASENEETLATRILADIAIVTESLVYSTNNIANAIFIIAAVQIVLLLLILWRVW